MRLMPLLRFAGLLCLLQSMAMAEEGPPSRGQTGCVRTAPEAACKCRKPAYPADALRRGEQGTTSIAATIDPGGLVSQVELVRSSGSASLDNATLDYFRDVCFKPLRDADGNPMTKRIRVDYVWKLES